MPSKTYKNLVSALFSSFFFSLLFCSFLSFFCLFTSSARSHLQNIYSWCCVVVHIIYIFVCLDHFNNNNTLYIHWISFDFSVAQCNRLWLLLAVCAVYDGEAHRLSRRTKLRRKQDGLQQHNMARERDILQHIAFSSFHFSCCCCLLNERKWHQIIYWTIP